MKTIDKRSLNRYHCTVCTI